MLFSINRFTSFNHRKKNRIFLNTFQLFTTSFFMNFLIHVETNNLSERGWVSRRTKATQWSIADDLTFVSKDGQKTCNHNFDLPRRGWLPHFGTPRGIIWMRTWRTLHPWRILHAPDAISVYGVASQASLEPGRSRTELSALPTERPRPAKVWEF